MTSSLLTINVFCIIFCCNTGVGAVDEPTRVAQFASLEVYQGQSVELPCTVSASPDLSVCWHVASDLTVNTGSRYISFCADPERSDDDGRHTVIVNEKSGTYNLKIDPVVNSDAGLYMCAVLNEIGIAVLFGNGRLSVVDSVVPSAAPTCQFLARDVLPEGEMVSATCFAASDGVPAPSLQWISNSENNPFSQIIIADANQLNWEVGPDDEDTIYTCLERHIALEVPRNCTVGPLRVIYRPIVKINAEPSQPEIGQNVKITCSVKSKPRATEIMWYIEGVSLEEVKEKFNYQIDSEQNSKVNISRLTLFNFTEELFNSTIACSAENSQGTRNTTILFSEPPEKPKYNTYNNLKTVLILDLVALAVIVFFSVCVIGCWTTWTNLSHKLRGACYKAASAEPHHVPL